MKSMTVDESTTWFDTMVELWHKFRSNRIVRAILWARWIITVTGFLATILWYAYVEGQDISENLSADYKLVQTAQATLIDDSLRLQEDLLNSKVQIPLDEELDQLQAKARSTIGALSGLRAPSETIQKAQRDYRTALEQMIAVTSRLERGEVEGMALSLHNGLQNVANAGGSFNQSVRDFQGGMLPQLVGSVF